MKNSENIIESNFATNAEIIHKMPNQYQLALQDVIDGLKNWRIWTLLSWQDIRLRYRRSQLGPFWLTISMAITIYTMGFLYGHLFKTSIRSYFPFLAAGMLSWNLISLLIVEETTAFIGAEHFLKQLKLPFSTFVLRIIFRCFIIFMHNIVVMIPLYFVFHIQLTPAVLFIIPSLLLLFFNAFCYGFILAVIAARFRDVAQLINSVIQVIFFLTPIMWNPDILPEKYQIWVMLNPFAQYVELLRAPLMSTMPSLYSIVAVLFLSVLGMYLAARLMLRIRHRIIFWI